ncbi:HAMP domain-containing histidine kinase [Iningainema sp. BLCCT55]|uniref:histidine kinase n=2 Tax=Iningainema TaxID=1932705 RepID=A0A8J6XTF9_9CYAN|nr:HAMP domain-containing histidine kinase [Iningainema tapete BLCC-T55]
MRFENQQDSSRAVLRGSLDAAFTSLWDVMQSDPRNDKPAVILVTNISYGTERIRDIVKSLRSFSRLDEAEVKAVDIHEGIDSTLLILQHRLLAKTDRREIEVTKHYSQLPLVECYAGQLNQVFMNILANAIDALEESLVVNTNHQPVITIRTELIDIQWVRITIADNGCGIPKVIQSRIFDPFFTTKSVGKGTGMGMSISYQIVTGNHGGKLYCQSAPSQGAEFLIEIPVRQSIV